jgi:hypothetical protein
MPVECGAPGGERALPLRRRGRSLCGLCEHDRGDEDAGDDRCDPTNVRRVRHHRFSFRVPPDAARLFAERVRHPSTMDKGPLKALQFSGIAW